MDFCLSLAFAFFSSVFCHMSIQPFSPRWVSISTSATNQMPFSRLMELCNFRALYDIAKSLEFKSICSIEMFVCICKRIADVSKWRTGGWKSLLSISYYIALHTCKYNNTELKKRNGKNRKMFGCAARTGCSVRVIAVVLFELGAFKQPTYHIHTYPLPCHAIACLANRFKLRFLELHVLKCAQTQNIRTRLCRRRFQTCVLFRFSFSLCVVIATARLPFFILCFFSASPVFRSNSRRKQKKCRHLQQTQAATNDGTAGKRNPCRWRSRIRRKKRDFFKTVNNLVYARGYIVYGICNERHSKKSYSPSKLQIHIFSLLQIVFGFIMPNTK